MLITISLSALLIISTVLLFLSISAYSKNKTKNLDIEKIYSPASFIEKEFLTTTNKYTALQSEYQKKLKQLQDGEKRLENYNVGIGTVDSVAYTSLSNNLTVQDIENQLQDIQTSLKQLVSNKKACICSIGKDFVVNGKKSEAKKLFDREVKLRLRCLDNEFKAAMSVVDWNNINRLVERTENTFNEINASGNTVKTYLQNSYLKLKIEELRLTYELNQLKQDIKETEREEAAAKREAEREEKKIKAAAEKLERERELMEKLVAEELSKLDQNSSEQKALYELHLRELEILREKEKRAVSLAQLTRAGYVYIISNELSFGSNVVKIGMTRRADPNDRVKELGDASVPEFFTVHAFIYTDDAPSLEKHLHRSFAKERVNLVNNRKEFFYASHEAVLDKLSDFSGKYELIESTLI